MKKTKTITIVIVGCVLALILATVILLLLIPGQYSFLGFWSMFFDKIFNWSAFIAAFGPIASKIPTSLIVTFISMIFGLLLGLLFALVSLAKIPVLNQLRAVFVSFVRGTPVIVQLYLSYTGIPLILKAINMNYGTQYNINAVDPMVLVIIAFSLNEAAYNSETIRAAIQSVDVGQIEAAKSLGMTPFQVFKRVTLKEAATVATAPLGNALIGLLKGTSLAFVASVVEMTAEAQILGGSNFRVFEAYFALALLYWPLTIILEMTIHFIEWKLEIKMPKGLNTAGFIKDSLLKPFDNHAIDADTGVGK